MREQRQMSNDNLYKDFIEALRQDAEENKGILAELKYTNRKMDELNAMQEKNFTLLEKRSERLDKLFTRLCASNDK